MHHFLLPALAYTLELAASGRGFSVVLRTFGDDGHAIEAIRALLRLSSAWSRWSAYQPVPSLARIVGPYQAGILLKANLSCRRRRRRHLHQLLLGHRMLGAEASSTRIIFAAFLCASTRAVTAACVRVRKAKVGVERGRRQGRSQRQLQRHQEAGPVPVV